MAEAATLAAVTLTASAVKETTATLTIANHTAAWWYKGSQDGATCTSVGASTTTADLADLTGGTSYTYKAYKDTDGDGDCDSGDELTTSSTDADFSTVGLTAGSLTKAAATLTLANWTAAWWHNKTTGPGSASCTSVNANTSTADLSGLTANSGYTWAVYSDSTCSTRIADVDFTTLEASTLTTSSVTHNSVTLSIGNYSGGSWYYKANAAPHASCSSAVSGARESWPASRATPATPTRRTTTAAVRTSWPWRPRSSPSRPSPPSRSRRPARAAASSR